jgi:arylsulfatase
MIRKPLLLKGLDRGIIFLGVSFVLCLSPCCSKIAPKRPAIIIITIDTLRVDHLGTYGYHRKTSPHIDQFAADALVFDNCFSHAPSTCSSIASIMSGFLPHETNVFGNQPLPSEVVTLPEILKEYGYKTVAVVSNYVLHKDKGYEQGFMIYDDTMENRELDRHVPERIAEHTTARSIELLKQFHDDQLFLWIHYQDPHGPYTPPDRYAKLFYDTNQKARNLTLNDSVSGHRGIPSYQKLGTNRDFYHYINQYDGEIRYLDEQFNRLIEALKEFGLYDDALIIVTADHGEGMGENNYYFAHGEYLYNTLLHVPLIIKFGSEPVGRRTDFVQHIDIITTIVKLLNIETNSPFRGCDLRRQQATNRGIFSEMKLPWTRGFRLSLVLDSIKLVYTSSIKEYQLFDLRKDPYEEKNLFNDMPYQEQVEDLKVMLERICKEDFLKIRKDTMNRKLTDEEKEKMKALGYIE